MTARMLGLWCLVVTTCTGEAALAQVISPVRDDWPQSRGSAQSLGSTRFRAAVAKAPRNWTFNGSGRVWGYEPGMSVWTPPAVGVIRGRAVLVVGSYDRNLYALDATSGEELWRFTAGDGIYAAPVIWRQGERWWIFATAADRLLYALDGETGRLEWAFPIAEYRPTHGGARLSSPSVGVVHAEPAVFFGHWLWDRSLAQNQQVAGVTALRARDGVVLWQRRLGDNELTAPLYVSDDRARRLYVGSSSGQLLALNADDGSILWQRTELDAIRGSPALLQLADRKRLVSASKFGLVRCLDAETGSELWQYKTGDWITSSPAVAVVGQRPQVFVGSYDRGLYSIDLLSGELVWRYFSRGGIYSSPAVVPDPPAPIVVVAAWDHALHAVSAREGTALWTLGFGRPIWDAIGLEHSAWSSPVIARINDDDMLYFGSYDGTFYAWRLDEITAQTRGTPRASRFWLSMLLALVSIASVALLLTYRYRRSGHSV